MAKLRGADIIVDTLIREKVPYVFGVMGHGVYGLMDVLAERQGEIKAVGTHHEQVAGHMADAYFRIAHRPVATYTSCGPGSVNHQMNVEIDASTSSTYMPAAPIAARCQRLGSIQESDTLQ